jgi:hypothetical protein
MTIEKVYNGYIVVNSRETMVYSTLVEVLNFTLLHFEGKSKSFGAESYGEVLIRDNKHLYELNPNDH